MLSKLSPSWKLLTSQAAAKEMDCAALVKQVGVVPREYLAFLREATETELLHESGRYLRIWGPVGCCEMDEAYAIRRQIPGAIPIGDDGGGNVCLYANGGKGFGIYEVGFGCLDPDELIWVSKSLTELLCETDG